MKLTIVNNGPAQLPISSDKDKPWADILPPGGPYLLDRSQVEDDIVTIGDNPSFTEEFKAAIGQVLKGVANVFEFWKERQKKLTGQTEKAMVTVTLTNSGENGIRVVLGDNTKAFELAPGESQNAEAENYIELRELDG